MRRIVVAGVVMAMFGACNGGSSSDPADSSGQSAAAPVGVLATIQMPHAGPFGVRVTPDGSKLFVPLFGTYGVEGPGSTVAVFDTRTNALLAEISVGERPEDIAFTSDGQYAYVTNSNSATVSAIHVPTLSVIATIPVGLAYDPETWAGTFPYGISIQGGTAYVFSSGGDYDGSDENIAILDVNPASPTFNTKTGGITLSGVFTRGAFRHGANELVIPRGAAGNDYNAPPEISFFDTTTDTYSASIPILQAPGGFHGIEDIAVTPNGEYAYAPFYSFGSGAAEVFVIDVKNRRFQDVITLPNGDISTHGVAMRPDGLLVGVTSWNAGTASFIFTPTDTVVSTYTTGANPNEIAFSPDGRRAYVTNQNAHTVTVIGLPSSEELMRSLLEGALNSGQASEEAAADLRWRLDELTQAMNAGDSAEAQAWVENLSIKTRSWARQGELQIGEVKDLAASGAALNGFAVPREGVLAAIQ